ncbi:hypothetical protein ABZ567_14815 [Streptomyces sp. NPDC016459]|uniref:hypothetical protein n=1 Tax=Streptomyces sp. NPDC016459 TaxID=3157190 RepID=UPI0033E9745C
MTGPVVTAAFGSPPVVDAPIGELPSAAFSVVAAPVVAIRMECAGSGIGAPSRRVILPV